MTHWIENIANELSKMDVEEHIIASGTSISGSIHMKKEKRLKQYGLQMTTTH